LARQSQQAWINSQHSLSPEMQEMQQPSLVSSHLQRPHVKLHWQQQTPFWQQQTLHIPSHSMRQRFCSAPQATSSSQLHQILQPSLHFSKRTVQRGRTCQLLTVGEPTGVAPVCQLG
jgi:hypothetical protein